MSTTAPLGLITYTPGTTNHSEENKALYERGMKRCSRCHEVKTLDRYKANKNGQFGIYCQCKDCTAPVVRAYELTHRDTKAEYNKRYRQENKERLSVLQKQKYEARKVNQPEKVEAACSYRTSRYRAKVAVSCGVTSPICKKTGFSLVRYEQNRFRAARADKPIERGERIVASLTFNAALKRWIVLEPTLSGVLSQEDWKLFRYFVRRGVSANA